MTSVRRFSVQRRVRRDLRVGDGYPGEVGARPALGIAIRGVDGDPEPAGRLRPLMLEMLGGGDDRERGDLAPGQQFGRDGEGVPGLARPGRSDQEEVTSGQPEVLVIRVLLPPSETRL